MKRGLRSEAGIVKALVGLSRARLVRVQRAAVRLIADADGKGAEPGRYALEFVKCGDAQCGCKKDGKKGHGPYWMHYFRDKDGKRRKRYIGKTKPAGA